jgi:hypothetical protein
MEVLGFEGYWRNEHLVTCGSAALWDGTSVINMGSGLGRPGRGGWDEAVEARAVTVFQRPIPVKPDALSRGAVVLALRGCLDGGVAAPGLSRFAAGRSLGAWAQEDYTAILYPDAESFDADVRAYVESLCEDLDALVSTALVLNAHSLELNALRTTLRLLREAPDRDAFAKAMGRAILRGDTDPVAFDRIFGTEKK